jgi:hypothetical protein
MIWHWQFDPIALHVGPLQLHWYGVLFALAFVLGQQLLAWCYRREGYDSQALDSLMPWALIGTVQQRTSGSHTLLLRYLPRAHRTSGASLFQTSSIMHFNREVKL